MPHSKTQVKTHFSKLKSPYASKANWFWKTVRNREKKLFLELIKNVNKEVCLDLGAGSCEYSEILLHNGANKSVCVDFNPSLMAGGLNSGIKKVIADVETYEPNEKYDLILCLGILEFLDKPESFFTRISEFLKPQGKIIVLLPFSKAWSLGYSFLYLLRGVSIHPLTLKEINHYAAQKGFHLHKTASCGLFSGFSIYSPSGN